MRQPTTPLLDRLAIIELGPQRTERTDVFTETIHPDIDATAAVQELGLRKPPTFAGKSLAVAPWQRSYAQYVPATNTIEIDWRQLNDLAPLARTGRPMRSVEAVIAHELYHAKQSQDAADEGRDLLAEYRRIVLDRRRRGLFGFDGDNPIEAPADAWGSTHEHLIKLVR